MPGDFLFSRLRARHEKRKSGSVFDMSSASGGGSYEGVGAVDHDDITNSYGSIRRVPSYDARRLFVGSTSLGGGVVRPVMATSDSPLKEILLSRYLNLLLILFPIGIAAELFKWGTTSVFVINFLAILPLAQLLGDFTEEIALYTNETIGGLINATLGKNI